MADFAAATPEDVPMVVPIKAAVWPHLLSVRGSEAVAWERSPAEALVLVDSAPEAATAASLLACEMKIRMSPLVACGGGSDGSGKYPAGKCGSQASFNFI